MKKNFAKVFGNSKQEVVGTCICGAALVPSVVWIVDHVQGGSLSCVAMSCIATSLLLVGLYIVGRRPQK